MPARETEAIILKTFPLGEADRLVSFLGRSSGRLRGVASGARLIKNRYGSTLEVLSHVQVWYIEREENSSGAQDSEYFSERPLLLFGRSQMMQNQHRNRRRKAFLREW